MKVKDLEVKHLSLCDFQIGDTWPSIYRTYEKENRKKTEEILEHYRKSTDIINSRKESLFVCHNDYQVHNWGVKKFKGKPPYLYTLKITGNLFWVDARYYEKLFELVDNDVTHGVKFKEYSLNYWTEVDSDEEYPTLAEGLFIGEAIIMDKTQKFF